MSEVFGDYATFYDTIYAQKDYAAECDNLERVFREFGAGPIRTVLDLGCGTGGHSVRLAERGYDVTGVDRSASMLNIARAKATVGAGKARFVENDIRDVSLGRRFDAVIAMFAVISYLTTDEDLQAAFAVVRRHLNPGGLLYFDAWFGPGVLSDPPSERFKVIPGQDGEIVRLASPHLDLASQTVDVRYRVLRRVATSLTDDLSETHAMRFFFPRELALLLAGAGLRLVSLHPEGRQDSQLNSREWQIGAVALAI